VLAVPVAPPSADRALRGDADEVICLEMPVHFQAIGEWYEDFAQTSDEEVVALLQTGHADDGQEEQVRERQVDQPQENVPDQATDGQAEPAAEQAPAGPGAGESRGELDGLVAMMPFAAGLGVVLDAAAPGEVRGRMAWAPQRCTSGGILHGGVLMALADSLGGICAFLNLPPGVLTATTSSATVFTRAVRSGQVIAVTRPLHVGRTMIVVQTDLTDDAGRRVAQVTQTQAVLAGRG
jgi:1,4-dihydroxy-2-naphthoyl-CoA hydrolase